MPLDQFVTTHNVSAFVFAYIQLAQLAKQLQFTVTIFSPLACCSRQSQAPKQQLTGPTGLSSSLIVATVQLAIKWRCLVPCQSNITANTTATEPRLARILSRIYSFNCRKSNSSKRPDKRKAATDLIRSCTFVLDSHCYCFAVRYFYLQFSHLSW